MKQIINLHRVRISKTIDSQKIPSIARKSDAAGKKCLPKMLKNLRIILWNVQRVQLSFEN